MAGLLTKGITLSYKNAETYEVIHNLQSCPALGGAAEKVDVTTLEDGNYKYINGIKDFGELAFGFLYDNSTATSNYRVCRGLEDAGEMVEWKVEFPDGASFLFSGECSTSIDEGAVNAAITFTLNITLNSDISFSAPTAG
jgi:hypothetical protein